MKRASFERPCHAVNLNGYGESESPGVRGEPRVAYHDARPSALPPRVGVARIPFSAFPRLDLGKYRNLKP